MTNILFVCRYNRFRSRIAAASFKKLNKNKNIKIKSAGVIRGSPLSPLTVGIAKEFGLDIRGRVNGLTSKIMKWQNITVIVANDVPPALFNKNKKYGKKVIIWRIPDIKDNSKESARKIIREIIKKTAKLAKQLKKEEA